MDDLRIIVGLGNPGEEYAKTRHNAGFMLVECLAGRWNSGWSAEKKFQSQISRTERSGKRVVLCKPQTFMNASGEAVGALVKFYQSPAANLVVAVDDADLPFGEIRLRPAGGSGGHHGLDSMASHLGSKDFARLRIGIGRRDGLREITGHVLGKLSTAEMKMMERILARAADQIECWIVHGLQKAMSQFNGVIEDSTNEGKKQ